MYLRVVDHYNDQSISAYVTPSSKYPFYLTAISSHGLEITNDLTVCMILDRLSFSIAA